VFSHTLICIASFSFTRALFRSRGAKMENLLMKHLTTAPFYIELPPEDAPFFFSERDAAPRLGRIFPSCMSPSRSIASLRMFSHQLAPSCHFAQRVFSSRIRDKRMLVSVVSSFLDVLNNPIFALRQFTGLPRRFPTRFPQIWNLTIFFITSESLLFDPLSFPLQQGDSIAP